MIGVIWKRIYFIFSRRFISKIPKKNEENFIGIMS